MRPTLAALAALLVVASLAACSAWVREREEPEGAKRVPSADARPTHVAIMIERGRVGRPGKPPRSESFTLECGAVAGKALNPSACRRLSRQDRRLFETKSRTCTFVEWVRAAPVLRVVGHVRGHPVHLRFDGADCLPPAFFAWTRVAAWR